MPRLSSKILALLISLSFLSTLSIPAVSQAQSVIHLNAADLVRHTAISVTPANGTFTEGSTFEVPILIDTKGASVNAIELHITYDPAVLSIISPSSGGKSIIAVWVQPPTFDNTKGTASLAGVIPNGITSGAGQIISLTFKAKAPGESSVAVNDQSHVLLNDGAGSETTVDSSRGVYTIIPKPPAGVNVISDTHPFQDHWYNNNSPTLSWTRDPGVTGWSYVLDNKPNTVPGNTVISTSTSISYQNLPDGISYFHIKADKQGTWGSATDFVIRIDTTPPAEFTPTVGYLSAAVVDRYLVSFFTTDDLSGVEHYEVGVIDKNSPTTETPIFTESQSPYQLPAMTTTAHVIVRAFDEAGNIREESIDVAPPFFLENFFKAHEVGILLTIIILIIAYGLIHYFFGHHIVERIKRVIEIFKKESKKNKEP